MLHYLKGKRWLTILAVTLAAMMPFAALAQGNADKSGQANTETNGQNAGFSMGSNSFGNNRGMFGMNDVDVSTLTDEQKTVYTQAVTLYEQVEDQVLADLVTAGAVTQADVDAYTTLRADEKLISDIDMTSWTAAQYKAYYEANAKTGDERKTAMQALADAGQLTQAQADALGAQGQTNLWTTIEKNEGTNTAIQTAMSTIRQARQTMQQTLRSAGIQGNGQNMMNGTQDQNGMPRQNDGNGMNQQPGNSNAGSAPAGNAPAGNNSNSGTDTAAQGTTTVQ